MTLVVLSPDDVIARIGCTRRQAISAVRAAGGKNIGGGHWRVTENRLNEWLDSGEDYLRLPYKPVFVYFIECGDGGPIKIGLAADPEKRMAELQPANPFRLRIIGRMHGGVDLEQSLHALFWSSHIRGEWFERMDRILRYIDERTSRVRLPTQRDIGRVLAQADVV